MKGIGDFLGLPGPVRWERALLLYAGLFAYDLVGITIGRWRRGEWGYWPEFVFDSLWSNAVLILVIQVAFRVVRPPFAAAAVAALAFSLLRSVIEWIPGQGFGASFSDPLFWLNLGVDFAWILGFLVGLEFMLARSKPIGLAALVAAVAAFLLSMLVRTAAPLAGIPSPFAGAELWQRVPVSLAAAVCLALVITVGWWLAGVNEDRSGAPPRMSRAFHVGVLYVLFGIPCVIGVVVATLDLSGLWAEANQESVWPLLAATLAMIVAGAIIFLIVIHRMWSAIQGPGARMTPGRAVGLLFVPVFNLYWMFQVFPGFARDYNAVSAAQDPEARPLPTGLFLAYPVLALLAAIPGAGVFLTPLSVAVALLMVGKTCDAVNALNGEP